MARIPPLSTSASKHCEIPEKSVWFSQVFDSRRKKEKRSTSQSRFQTLDDSQRLRFKQAKEQISHKKNNSFHFLDYFQKRIALSRSKVTFPRIAFPGKFARMKTSPRLLTTFCVHFAVLGSHCFPFFFGFVLVRCTWLFSQRLHSRVFYFLSLNRPWGLLNWWERKIPRAVIKGRIKLISGRGDVN